MQFDWEKPENSLNFELVKDSFDKLLKATEHKIEREWPAALGSVGWHSTPFLLSLKVGRWTYVSSIYLLADLPEKSGRHLEFAIAVPPLNRTILDMVFNLVFLFDDFEGRLCWYLDSGLKELERRAERFAATYSADPTWNSWFAKLSDVKKGFLTHRDNVCGNRQPPRDWFPHPGKIVRGNIPFKNPKSLDFLKYLNDWFYRDLSSASHGHWLGLAESGAQILRIQADEGTQTKFAKKYKSDCIFQQMTLILCLVSEIIIAANFDNKHQAAYMWTILAAYWGEAKELHALRYSELLT